MTDDTLAKIKAAAARVLQAMKPCTIYQDTTPMRLCHTCGREEPADKVPYRGEPDDCPEQELDGEKFRLCMFDMTTEEGLNYWKQKAHEVEARASTARDEALEEAAKALQAMKPEYNDGPSMHVENMTLGRAVIAIHNLKGKP